MTPAEVDQRMHDDAVTLARQRAYWITLAKDPLAGTTGIKTRRQCLAMARGVERVIIIRAQIVEDDARDRAARCAEVSA